MSLQKLKNNFNKLFNEVSLDPENRSKVDLILNLISISDKDEKTRFEFSLQIENKKLKKTLRFVNYDSYHENRASFLRRISLLEDIFLTFSEESELKNVLIILKGIKSLKFPLTIGFEIKQGNIFFKLYLNFFNLNLKDESLANNFVGTILKILKIDPNIKEEKIAMLGLIYNASGSLISHKIYYIYNNERFISMYFTKEIRNRFDWLYKRNRLDYFDVMERYSGGSFISKKIEIHPRVSRNFLAELLAVTKNKVLLDRIRTIIKNTEGEIEVVALEKNRLSLYITFLTYGKPKKTKIQ